MFVKAKFSDIHIGHITSLSILYFYCFEFLDIFHESGENTDYILLHFQHDCSFDFIFCKMVFLVLQVSFISFDKFQKEVVFF